VPLEVGLDAALTAKYSTIDHLDGHRRGDVRGSAAADGAGERLLRARRRWGSWTRPASPRSWVASRRRAWPWSRRRS
jgi:hypothetical protein